jgi:hypothetical protein
MFRAFFAALSALTANAQALADSFAEANQRFRANLLLDGPAPSPGELIDNPPALPDPTADREPAAGNSGKRGRKTAV